MEAPISGATHEHRGRLKVYLGTTPGSGKTFAMLYEGRLRREQGEDVVAGFIEPHGRPRTAEAIGDLEVIPRISIEYHGTRLEEMDLDGVLARRPHVVLVDELAHTNAEGSRHRKRWEDIEAIRRAGIDVITTMNVQHLESVKDLVERITNVRIQETVPDTVLDAADEIQFIDITPEALRKRMRHGNVYPMDRVDTALRNFFRTGNLAALREIGLRYVADRVGDVRGGVEAPHEDVLVAVSGRATTELLVRRAVRIARRSRGLCTVLNVQPAIEDTAGEPPLPWKHMVAQLGCSVIERSGMDVADAIIEVTRELGSRHVVLGEPHDSGSLMRWRPTVVDRIVDALPDVDVHVIARYPHLRHGAQERPTPEAMLRRITEEQPSARGGLRVYLGYVRGVGATNTMLNEARRRAGRGTDVVVAALAPRSARWAEGLQYLGGPHSSAAGGVLDVAELLKRNPEVAAIDDLAGPTSDGGSVAGYIDRIRDAGITVISTVHLVDVESTVDTMGLLVGRAADKPVVPDAVLDQADELELVDVIPEIVEERLRNGEIVAPADVASALQSEFRPEVLTMLRQAAFRRVASHTDRRLLSYMQFAHIRDAWEARPRVLVLVPSRPDQEKLIARAAEVAALRDDAMIAISVRSGKYTDEEKNLLGRYAALTHRLGGEFVSVYGKDVAREVAQYAKEHLITEILAMRSPGRRQSHSLHRLIRFITDINVHILAGIG
jgi:two-component system, OmpR family, sensor histidine kinase KdpD